MKAFFTHEEDLNSSRLCKCIMQIMRSHVFLNLYSPCTEHLGNLTVCLSRIHEKSSFRYVSFLVVSVFIMYSPIFAGQIYSLVHFALAFTHTEKGTEPFIVMHCRDVSRISTHSGCSSDGGGWGGGASSTDFMMSFERLRFHHSLKFTTY